MSIDELRNAIPRQRRSDEQALIMADDQLIEAVRHGRITGDSPVHPVFRMLAQWRRRIIAGT